MSHGGFDSNDRQAFRLAAEAAADYRQALEHTPIRANKTYDEMLDVFDEALPETGISSDEIITLLDEKGRDGLSDVCNPRFFGYVIGGGHPAAAAADMLVAAWNQNSPMLQVTPTAAALEELSRRWLLDILDLPRDASLGMTTGGTMANAVALAAARNEMLHRQGWDVEAKGLYGAPEIPVIVGAEAHSSIFSGLRLLGFGAERVLTVPADDQGRMQAAKLAEIVSGLDSAPIIVAQAGQINSGAIDPVTAIADIADSAGAWLHVDGAFGLWAHAHPDLKSQLKGVERAQSWIVDGHKWLQVTYDCGFVFVADRAAHVRAMGHSAAYLPNTGTMQDPGDFVPELSRRARGVPVWAVLKAFGRQGIIDLIGKNCRLARRMADALGRESGVHILNDVNLNQVTVAFGPEGEVGDEMTGRVLQAVQAEGVCYPSHGVWRGRKIMRLSVTGFATTDEDADRSVDAIIRAWRDDENRTRHKPTEHLQIMPDLEGQ